MKILPHRRPVHFSNFSNIHNGNLQHDKKGLLSAQNVFGFANPLCSVTVSLPNVFSYKTVVSCDLSC